MNDAATPNALPKAQVASAGAALFAVIFTMLVSQPFTPFMVHTMYPELEQHELGDYAGYVDSAYHLGGVFSSFFWGKLSDRIGRRPVLIMGLLGLAISTVLFGLCRSFPLALFTRVLAGVLNGVAPVAKSYVGDITDNTNSAQGFALIGMMGGLARLVGPATGGYLSQSATKYPGSVLDTPLLRKYEFLLPCVVAALVNVAAVIVVFIPNQRAGGKGSYALVAVHDCDDDDDDVDDVEDLRSVSSDVEDMPLVSSSDGESGGDRHRAEFEFEFEGAAMELAGRRTERWAEHRAPEQAAAAAAAEEEEVEEGVEGGVDEGVDEELFAEVDVSAAGRVGESVSSFTESVVKCIALYTILCFTGFGGNMVFPLWSLLPPPRGFGYDSSNVADVTTRIPAVITACGPAQLLVQLFLYAKIVARLGFKASMGLSFLLLPFMPGELLMAGTFVWNTVSRIVALTTVNALISNSCDDANRGAIMGVSQTVSSLGRMGGPAIMATLFAWSCKDGAGGAGADQTRSIIDYHFVFLLLAACACFSAGGTLTLPAAIDLKRK